MKQRIVTEQLQRIGGIAEPPVRDTVTPASFGYRSQSRFAVDGRGRLGYRRLRGNDIVPVDTCLLLTPEAQQVRDEAGDGWTGAEEVTVRHDGSDGAIVVTAGPDGLAPLPDGAAAVAVRTPSGSVALRGDATMHVVIDELSYRVSPTSFFQAGPLGAAAIMGLVRDAAAVGAGDHALDLYAGVGLFAKALAADGATVTAVESHATACTDAEVNLADLAAAVRQEPAERAVDRFVAEGTTFDVVVLDPPRAGAGARLCAALPALRPRVIVYVSCDPAALARDTKALIAAGYGLEVATPVDQFAQTAAIETVAVFRPAGS
jgi:tRNA/tmRNA/rRNA uracil-C5-methylase (TrmA/RlmC/RlmD family)